MTTVDKKKINALKGKVEPSASKEDKKKDMKKKLHEMIEALVNGKSEDATVSLHAYLREKSQDLMSKKDMDAEEEMDADDEDKDDEEDSEKEDEDDDEDKDEEEDSEKEDEDDDEDDDDNEDKDDELTEAEKKIKFSKKPHVNSKFKFKRMSVGKGMKK